MNQIYSELDHFQNQIQTIDDCEKKLKVLQELFHREVDELEKLALNKYILRLQARLTSLRVDSFKAIHYLK